MTNNLCTKRQTGAIDLSGSINLTGLKGSAFSIRSLSVLSVLNVFIISVLAACCVSSVSLAFTKTEAQFLPLVGAKLKDKNKDKNKDKDNTLGPYYKAVLPTSIYLNSIKPDLSDVRLKNAEGDYLAYAFVDEESSTVQIKNTVVPIFPLYEDARTALAKQDSRNANDDYNSHLNSHLNSSLNIHLYIQKDGSLAKGKDSEQLTSSSSSTSKAQVIKGWIIDTSQLLTNTKNKQYFLQAQVDIAKDNKGIADFYLQSSDDLQHWTSTYYSHDANTSASAHQQLVQLEHQGVFIQKLTINLYNSRAKYWRLLWKNTDNAFDIKSVSITTQEKLLPSPVLTWGASIAANHCDQTSCEYTLPNNTPIDSLRIQLGEVNTLAKMTIVGKRAQQVQTGSRRHRNPLYVLRHRDHAPNYKTQIQEDYLQEVTIYRLQLSQKESVETQSDDIALNGQVYTHLRLITQADMRSLGKRMPSIQIGTLSRSIVFLARGKEPFTLQWGEENPVGTALPLATLMPNAVQLHNEHMGEAQLAPIPLMSSENAVKNETISTNHVDKKQYKYWLLGVLGLAVLLLGAMVWSFLNGMKEAKKEAKKETEK